MYLLYHTFGGLSRGFLKFFQKIFSELLAQCCRIDRFVFPPPLDYVFIISQSNRKVNSFFEKSFRQIAQISGNRLGVNLYNLPIDFLCAVWYNENSARCERGRAAEFCTKRKEVEGFPPTSVIYQLIFHHFHPFLSYACGSRGGLTTNPRLSRAFCKVS